MSDPQISAIICTHNREEYLGAAIDSVLQQDFYSYEVVIVDNASSDRTREIVAEREEIMRHKWLESEKAGRDIGFNQALINWVLHHRTNWRAARQRTRTSAPQGLLTV